jgi:hypothetical protein
MSTIFIKISNFYILSKTSPNKRFLTFYQFLIEMLSSHRLVNCVDLVTYWGHYAQIDSFSIASSLWNIHLQYDCNVLSIFLVVYYLFRPPQKSYIFILIREGEHNYQNILMFILQFIYFLQWIWSTLSSYKLNLLLPFDEKHKKNIFNEEIIDTIRIGYLD